jgi:hypothetical protein
MQMYSSDSGFQVAMVRGSGSSGNHALANFQGDDRCTVPNLQFGKAHLRGQKYYGTMNANTLFSRLPFA